MVPDALEFCHGFRGLLQFEIGLTAPVLWARIAGGFITAQKNQRHKLIEVSRLYRRFIPTTSALLLTGLQTWLYGWLYALAWSAAKNLLVHDDKSISPTKIF